MKAHQVLSNPPESFFTQPSRCRGSRPYFVAILALGRNVAVVPSTGPFVLVAKGFGVLLCMAPC